MGQFSTIGPWLLALASLPFVPYYLFISRKQVAELGGKLERALRQSEEFMATIGDLKAKNEALQRQIDDRPTRTEVRYGVATVGYSGCGKTALTLRWANPRIKPEQVKATQFAKYDKTVSRVYDSDSRVPVDHIFEIYDWGGEHIEEALTALVKLGAIHALLVVVSLAAYDRKSEKHEFSQEHIDKQLQEFDQQVLRFFFSPAVVQHCKHYVLFINKSDLLAGTPEAIEAKAMQYFEQLIKDMRNFSENRGVNCEVIVGSADKGTGTNKLYSHLIEHILPDDARDPELIQAFDDERLRGATTGPKETGATGARGQRAPETFRQRPGSQ